MVAGGGEVAVAGGSGRRQETVAGGSGKKYGLLIFRLQIFVLYTKLMSTKFVNSTSILVYWAISSPQFQFRHNLAFSLNDNDDFSFFIFDFKIVSDFFSLASSCFFKDLCQFPGNRNLSLISKKFDNLV